jgi:hypothetical protein
MKYLLMLLLLPGCMTTYSISKIMPDGSNIVVEVQSFREFEQPQVHYNRTDDAVTFDFGAASSTTAISPVEQAAASLLLQLPALLAPIGE